MLRSWTIKTLALSLIAVSMLMSLPPTASAQGPAWEWVLYDLDCTNVDLACQSPPDWTKEEIGTFEVLVDDPTLVPATLPVQVWGADFNGKQYRYDTTITVGQYAAISVGTLFANPIPDIVFPVPGIDITAVGVLVPNAIEFHVSYTAINASCPPAPVALMEHNMEYFDTNCSNGETGIVTLSDSCGWPAVSDLIWVWVDASSNVVGTDRMSGLRAGTYYRTSPPGTDLRYVVAVGPHCAAICKNTNGICE